MRRGEEWLRFFLRGIIETAGRAFAAAQAINALFASDRKRIEALGRVAGSALRVHQVLQAKPISTASRVAVATGLSLPTALTALSNLEALDIVNEITGRARSRMFTYAKYLAILESGTEP